MTVGQLVRLKPAHAKAYGFDPAEVYLVVRTFTRNGYKTPWIELSGGEMTAHFNVVKGNELR